MTTTRAEQDGMRRQAIERRSGLSRELFEREFLAGVGRPVIVTDALDNWRARTTWSFDFFRTHYGAEPLAMALPQAPGLLRLTNLAEYLTFLEQPDSRPPGFWIDTQTKIPCGGPELERGAFYLAGKWNAFAGNPALLADIDASPYFVDDWMAELPRDFLQLLQTANIRPYWVLFGPDGSKTGLHRDFLHTHAYIAQVVGRKQCVLFSPDDSACLYDGAVDPERPDYERFPLLRQATAFECIVEPGELLLVPADWWHAVRGLDCSITVSYNFFTRSNFGAYFVEFLRMLPGTIGGFDRSTPGWREQFGIDWTTARA
jgi:hypothetical protein